MIGLFRRFSQGLTSDTWNLKYPQISRIVLTAPSLPEQEKIASFLLLFDQKIELERNKLELLREFKKGLLQQMFV